MTAFGQQTQQPNYDAIRDGIMTAVRNYRSQVSFLREELESSGLGPGASTVLDKLIADGQLTVSPTDKTVSISPSWMGGK